MGKKWNKIQNIIDRILTTIFWIIVILVIILSCRKP